LAQEVGQMSLAYLLAGVHAIQAKRCTGCCRVNDGSNCRG
jgi:hypothetical protein